MANDDGTRSNAARVQTCRYLFYLSLLQVIVFFIVPAVIFPRRYVIYLEVLAASTFGVFVALHLLGMNIYAFFVDKRRRRLYVATIVVAAAWVCWAGVSWMFIEHMGYMLR